MYNTREEVDHLARRDQGAELFRMTDTAEVKSANMETVGVAAGGDERLARDRCRAEYGVRSGIPADIYELA